MSDAQITALNIEKEVLLDGRFKFMLEIEQAQRLSEALDKEIERTLERLQRRRNRRPMLQAVETIENSENPIDTTIEETKVFIGNVGQRISRGDLLSFFGRFGNIFDIYIGKSHNGNASFSFISFSPLNDEANLMQTTHYIKGCQLTVQPERKRDLPYQEPVTNFVSAVGLQMYKLKNSEVKRFFTAKLGIDNVISVTSTKYHKSDRKMIEFDCIPTVKTILSMQLYIKG